MTNYIKKYYKTIILAVLLILLIIFLVYYNIKKNLQGFLNTPLYAVVNIVVAVLVAFYLTQRKNDQRQLKNNIEHIIDKIQVAINNEWAYKIQSKSDIDNIIMMQRQVSNKLDVLKTQSKIFPQFEDDLQYVNERFKEYKEFFGNHMTNLSYLLESEKELRNPLGLIDDKLDCIKMSLYK